jgi:outer membrane protein assembly factor BamB
MVRRTSPPRWLWAFWLLAVVLVFVVRRVVDLGDSGMTNVASFVLVLLAVLAGLIWFVLRSAHPARVRYGSFAALIAVLYGLSWVVEVRGFSGQMVPVFGLRGGAAESPAAGPPVEGVGDIAGAVDLVTTTPYDFAGFLGSGRDARVDNVRLAPDWTTPPELLWKRPVGAAWSSFAVVNGFAATMEQRDEKEFVTLYSVATGDLVWAREIGGAFSHVLGGVGPRTTPLIHEGVVYAMGVRGHLVALAGDTGTILWERDLLADYGISIAEEDVDVAYGRSASPLVVGDSLVVAVGGSAANRVSAVAYQKRHGEVQWESGNHNTSMASPGVAQLAGVEQILMVNENWVSGHRSSDGAVLWQFPWPGITGQDSNASQAVPVAPDKVFISKGYGAGAAVFQLNPNGDGTFTPEPLWHSPRVLRTKLTNVAMKDGYVYGLSEGVLECVDVATGERMWKAGRYGHGQILLVGDVLLVLGEDGGLFMVEASPDSNNNLLGEIQAIDGHTWNNFALYGDIVLVRNAQEAAAYRLPLAESLDWSVPEPMGGPEADEDVADDAGEIGG